ncbi:MAG: hypothetical protein WCF85_10805, partial [Rhodospirillaceae bacterium]
TLATSLSQPMLIGFQALSMSNPTKLELAERARIDAAIKALAGSGATDPMEIIARVSDDLGKSQQKILAGLDRVGIPRPVPKFYRAPVSTEPGPTDAEHRAWLARVRAAERRQPVWVPRRASC